MASFEKLEVWWKPNLVYWYNMGAFICSCSQRSYTRSKVIWGQDVRLAENVKYTLFEKLKSNWNQTWFIDIMWEPSYVHDIRGHIPRSKGHLRSSCKIGWKCKIYLIWKIDVRLEPNLIFDIMWEPSYVHEVRGHIPRSKVIWDQIVRLKIWNWSHLKRWSLIGTKLGLWM